MNMPACLSLVAALLSSGCSAAHGRLERAVSTKGDAAVTDGDSVRDATATTIATQASAADGGGIIDATLDRNAPVSDVKPAAANAGDALPDAPMLADDAGNAD